MLSVSIGVRRIVVEYATAGAPPVLGQGRRGFDTRGTSPRYSGRRWSDWVITPIPQPTEILVHTMPPVVRIAVQGHYRNDADHLGPFFVEYAVGEDR